MSYDIYIGNAEMKPIDEEEEITPYTRLVGGKVVYYRPVVNGMKHPDAPTFPDDEMTGNGNNRHPGYRVWSEFIDATGLDDVFHHPETGLMREHPGYALITLEHVRAITQALESFRAMYPAATPRFRCSNEDAHLARLIWLDWWMRWTWANCEHAAVYNF